ITEAVADLFRLHPGSQISVPLAGRELRFTVAGVWRDYVRQNGALLLDRALYITLTEDRLVTDAGVWVEPGVDANRMREHIESELKASKHIEVSNPSEIRRPSLNIFDRTFAVTYALEACAILIGLFGLSGSVAALVLARRREFGMLRHIG